MAIHHLLNDRTVADAQRLQVALGRIRRASGHFQSQLLAIDPHRIRSFSKRQMRRFRGDESSKPKKVVQTFFALDPDTHQPVAFTIEEKPQKYRFGAFLSTTDRDEVDRVTVDFPKRWHVEEFFNAHQALGWNRAGTMNLNVRYGQMTMALLAQAAISQLRERIGEPLKTWDSAHLAKGFFAGMEGDIRVAGDTIVVTYYNAPNVERLRRHYENLPEKLAKEKIDPHISWLYDFKLDFRFK